MWKYYRETFETNQGAPQGETRSSQIQAALYGPALLISGQRLGKL